MLFDRDAMDDETGAWQRHATQTDSHSFFLVRFLIFILSIFLSLSFLFQQPYSDYRLFQTSE